MNSVPRKLTLGLILAIGAAACGDDVTVTEQTPVTPTPVVRSVVVSPASATIAPGGSFTFGAAVDADAGLARTVTWSSSNTNVAAVTAAGVATAPAGLTAGGVTSVCAVSTADADVKGCAQLTVNPAAAPTTVQIDAITVGCSALNAALPGGGLGCGLQVPVQVNNVGGQIDVAALIERSSGGGTQHVVFQVLDAAGTTVQRSYTQTLVADAIGSSELAAQQQSQNRIVQSINTAEYDLGGTGGSARVFFLNGEHKIRACVSPVVDSCTGAGVTASPVRTLTFRNANGFHMTVTGFVSGAAVTLASGNNQNGLAIRQVNAATGLSYNGGTGLAITGVPVSYTGQTVTAAGNTTVNFGSACDAGFGARALAGTVNANGIISGNLAYAAGSAAGAGNLNAYQITPGGACGALGEVPAATALDGTGNAFINFGLAGNFAGNTLNNILNPVVPSLGTVQAIRLDNGGPAAITGYVVNPNGRNFGWFNDAVLMNVVNSAANPDGVVLGAGAGDAGIGGTVTLQARGGACTTVATCAALAIRTNAVGLAQSATGTTPVASYNMIVQTVDLFGNFTNPGAVNGFGVDRALPYVTAVGGPANNSIVGNLAAPLAVNVSTGTTYSADDTTGTIGANPSGIQGPNNIIVTLQKRDATSQLFWCPSNAVFQPAAGACPNTLVLPLNNGWATGTTQYVTGAGALVGGLDPSGANVDAYYGVVVSARDNAGNVATQLGIRNIIHDQTVGTSAPAATGPQFLPSIIPAAGTVTFSGSWVENLDGARSAFGTVYPALTSGATFIRYPWTSTGSGAAAGGTTPTGFNFAGPSVTTPNPGPASVATVYRTIEQTNGTNNIAAAVTNATVAITGFQYIVWDVARNNSTIVTPPIGIGAISPLTGAGTAFWSNALAGGGAFTGMTWQVCSTVVIPGCTTVPAGNIDVSGNAAGANVNSRVLEAIVGSPTNPFQPPFALGGVKFYVVDAFQVAIGVPVGSALVEACTAGPPLNDQATNTWKYSCTYNPSTLRVAYDLFGFNETTALINAGFAVGQGVNVVAIGFNNGNQGLATLPIVFTHQP